MTLSDSYRAVQPAAGDPENPEVGFPHTESSVLSNKRRLDMKQQRCLQECSTAETGRIKFIEE